MLRQLCIIYSQRRLNCAATYLASAITAFKCTTTPSANHSTTVGTAKLKTLDIANKYSTTDVGRILGAINAAQTLAELQCYDITKGRAQTIRAWRNKNGPIQSVEQMLELDGFGVKNLDKFCASILRDDGADGDALKAGAAVAAVRQSTAPTSIRQQQFTTPALADSLRHKIRTCTALHVGISSITWAQLQLNAGSSGDTDNGKQPVITTTGPLRLLDWCIRSHSDKRMHVGELCEYVLNVCAELPASDVYVLESPRTAQQGPPGSPAQVNINVQMAQIIGMVSMAMAGRGRLSTNAVDIDDYSTAEVSADVDADVDALAANRRRVLFLRQLLSSRLFQTVVGVERISTESVVAALLDQSGCARDGRVLLAGEVMVPTELRQAYAIADGYCKEYMGQTLLMAVAFMRLCVLQCPESLAAVSRQKAK